MSAQSTHTCPFCKSDNAPNAEWCAHCYRRLDDGRGGPGDDSVSSDTAGIQPLEAAPVDPSAPSRSAYPHADASARDLTEPTTDLAKSTPIGVPVAPDHLEPVGTVATTGDQSRKVAIIAVTAGIIALTVVVFSVIAFARRFAEVESATVTPTTEDSTPAPAPPAGRSTLDVGATVAVGGLEFTPTSGCWLSSSIIYQRRDRRAKGQFCTISAFVHNPSTATAKLNTFGLLLVDIEQKHGVDLVSDPFGIPASREIGAGETVDLRLIWDIPVDSQPVALQVGDNVFSI